MGMLINPYAFATAAGISSVGPLLETGSSTTDVLTLPTYVAGDVVFIQLNHLDAGNHAFSPTPPTGFTRVSNLPAAANVLTLDVYRRVMDGSEGTTATLNLGIGSTQARAFTVSGVNGSGAVTEGVATSSDTGSGAAGATINLVGPNVTTSGNNRLLLSFCGTGRGTNNTMAESADAWTDIHMTKTTALSLNPAFSAAQQVAATTGTYTGETRTQQQTNAGDMFWGVIACAVILI